MDSLLSSVSKRKLVRLRDSQGDSGINPKFKTAIFDFDYTLADSGAAAVECINFALNGVGFPNTSSEKIRQTIGLQLPDAFRKLAGKQYMTRCDEFVRLFRERADEVMADMTALFDTVPEMVAILKRCGIALGIVSTKGRFRIQPVLLRENLLDSFEVIVGGEDVSEHKPSPQGLLAAIQRLGSSPSNSLYVGDSTIDAETAMRAGIPFVAVLSGVTPKENFRNYSVYGIIKNLLELPALMGCQTSPE